MSEPNEAISTGGAASALAASLFNPSATYTSNPTTPRRISHISQFLDQTAIATPASGSGTPRIATESCSNIGSPYSNNRFVNGTLTPLGSPARGRIHKPVNKKVPAKEFVATHFWNHYEQYVTAVRRGLFKQKTDRGKPKGLSYHSIEYGITSFDVHVEEGLLAAQNAAHKQAPVTRNDASKYAEWLANLSRREVAAIIIQRWWRAWLDFRRQAWPDLYDKPLPQVPQPEPYSWSSSSDSEENDSAARNRPPDIPPKTALLFPLRKASVQRSGFGSSAMKPMNMADKGPCKPSRISAGLNTPRQMAGGVERVTRLSQGSSSLSGAVQGDLQRFKSTENRLRDVSTSAPGYRFSLQGMTPDPSTETTPFESLDPLPQPPQNKQLQNFVESQTHTANEVCMSLDTSDKSKQNGQPSYTYTQHLLATNSDNDNDSLAPRQHSRQQQAKGPLKFWGGAVHNPGVQHDPRFFLQHVGQVHVQQQEQVLFDGAMHIRSVCKVLRPHTHQTTAEISGTTQLKQNKASAIGTKQRYNASSTDGFSSHSQEASLHTVRDKACSPSLQLHAWPPSLDSQGPQQDGGSYSSPSYLLNASASVEDEAQFSKPSSTPELVLPSSNSRQQLATSMPNLFVRPHTVSTARLHSLSITGPSCTTPSTTKRPATVQHVQDGKRNLLTRTEHTTTSLFGSSQAAEKVTDGPVGDEERSVGTPIPRQDIRFKAKSGANGSCAANTADNNDGMPVEFADYQVLQLRSTLVSRQHGMSHSSCWSPGSPLRQSPRQFMSDFGTGKHAGSSTSPKYLNSSACDDPSLVVHGVLSQGSATATTLDAKSKQQTEPDQEPGELTHTAHTQDTTGSLGVKPLHNKQLVGADQHLGVSTGWQANVVTSPRHQFGSESVFFSSSGTRQLDSPGNSNTRRKGLQSELRVVIPRVSSPAGSVRGMKTRSEPNSPLCPDETRIHNKGLGMQELTPMNGRTAGKAPGHMQQLILGKVLSTAPNPIAGLQHYLVSNAPVRSPRLDCSVQSEVSRMLRNIAASQPEVVLERSGSEYSEEDDW